MLAAAAEISVCGFFSSNGDDLASRNGAEQVFPHLILVDRASPLLYRVRSKFVRDRAQLSSPATTVI
jgi:hypothetical protein